MSRPYLILGTQRCGTTWLSNFMTWETSFCLHDGMLYYPEPRDLIARLSSPDHAFMGDADSTLAILAEDLIPELLQHEVKVVLVWRDLVDSTSSLLDYGKVSMRDHDKVVEIQKRIHHGLEMVAHSVDHIGIEFKELFTRGFVQRVWEWCVPGLQFPTARYELLRGMNVETDLSKMVAEIEHIGSPAWV